MSSTTVEATTVAASTAGPLFEHPNPQTREEMQEFLARYMPIKFGSVLTSKLNKKNKDGQSYWERGPAANKPFILAVADFHKPGKLDEPGSMTYTQSALWPYLYGHRVEWELVDGELKISAIKNREHVYREKVVPSGFFDLWTLKIFQRFSSHAGTLAKFDRMGVAAGFGDPDHRYFRGGLRYNHEPNSVAPKIFSADVAQRATKNFGPTSFSCFTTQMLNGRSLPHSLGLRNTSSKTERPVLASQTLIVGSIEKDRDGPLA